MTLNLKVTPLGGVGEIGALNCMLYETEKEAFVVDCGSMFPNEETLGVDLIIPDFSYLHQIRHKLKGVVLTHGHEDHVGAIPFLLQEFNLPVYAAPFTAGLIEQKLDEYPLIRKPQVTVFDPGDSISVGSFKIDTIFVNHSIIDASCLVIGTPWGPVVHLTDWKIDKTPIDGRVIDLKKFSAVGKSGVLALFSDSTNVLEPGATLSEREVERQLKKICGKHKGRIIATLFSSNIHRVQALVNTAKSLGRSVALVGRSMRENTSLARRLGRLSFEGVQVLDVEETHGLKPDRVMCLVTGTQGEPRSVLSRMACDQFKPFQIGEGDLVLFSSKVIPGNERNIFSVIDNLSRRGARVLYESVHEIHTSGHAHQDELKEIVRRLKPKYFIPIHGQYRHLMRHADLAERWGSKNALVVENGTPVVFERKGAKRGDAVQTGRVFVDGKGVGDVGDAVLRDRKHLSDTGIVICILMIDRKTGEIIRGPELISRGFIEEEEEALLLTEAKKVVLKALSAFNLSALTDMVEVQEEVRIVLRRFFKKALERKPVVIPVIMEV
ncbi:MAG: ribonuclease J [Deltaproteobacteria bacterium]|nr:ribonuclease J [Deltaproteobacteria bacterium]